MIACNACNSLLGTWERLHQQTHCLKPTWILWFRLQRSPSQHSWIAERCYCTKEALWEAPILFRVLLKTEPAGAQTTKNKPFDQGPSIGIYGLQRYVWVCPILIHKAVIAYFVASRVPFRTQLYAIMGMHSQYNICFFFSTWAMKLCKQMMKQNGQYLPRVTEWPSPSRRRWGYCLVFSLGLLTTISFQSTC